MCQWSLLVTQCISHDLTKLLTQRTILLILEYLVFGLCIRSLLALLANICFCQGSWYLFVFDTIPVLGNSPWLWINNIFRVNIFALFRECAPSIRGKSCLSACLPVCLSVRLFQFATGLLLAELHSSSNQSRASLWCQAQSTLKPVYSWSVSLSFIFSAGLSTRLASF